MSHLAFFDPDGPNGWLANFSHHHIIVAGQRYKTVEHYFQASKFIDPSVALAVLASPTPYEAKAIARTLQAQRRPDWPAIRLRRMYRGIFAKFSQHPELRLLLTNTLDATIVEAPTDDLFWGLDSLGRGDNHMGRLLMRLREYLAGR